jgi:hypothetical protein
MNTDKTAIRISHHREDESGVGLRQNRAQTREDEDVFLRESPLVSRHFVARIPLSTGARFCFSSAQGCLF